MVMLQMFDYLVEKDGQTSGAEIKDSNQQKATSEMEKARDGYTIAFAGNLGKSRFLDQLIADGNHASSEVRTVTESNRLTGFWNRDSIEVSNHRTGFRMCWKVTLVLCGTAKTSKKDRKRQGDISSTTVRINFPCIWQPGYR